MTSLRTRWVVALIAISCANASFAQSHNGNSKKESASSQSRSTDNSQVQARDAGPFNASRTSLPNSKMTLNSGGNSRPVTINQVERQTGGKVIGSKPVNIQGRQLNQIKMLMPNGRVVIHQQLFDEQGRSVETVNNDESDPESRAKSTDH